MNYIVQRLNDASDFFYDIYIEVYSWVWPFWEAGPLFYQLCLLFNKLAWDFYDFSSWVTATADKLTDILSWSTIRSYIRSWLPDLEDTIDWWYDWLYWVWDSIDDWWDSTSDEVWGWVLDVRSWTTTQINTARNSILTTISNLESWTIAEINSVRDSILAAISTVESWTTAQLNTIRASILAAISTVESWTTAQLNTIRASILAAVSDIEAWTIAEINTIKDLLGALIDWDKFIGWITAWWNDRVLDVQNLINSAFTSREPFWAGWQDWKDRVTEFFTDPEDWLYKAFDRIFERFW